MYISLQGFIFMLLCQIFHLSQTAAASSDVKLIHMAISALHRNILFKSGPSECEGLAQTAAVKHKSIIIAQNLLRQHARMMVHM